MNIDKIDILKYIRERGWEWDENKEYRVNHVSCPAGEDLRRRLYVKCVDPAGSFIGHCFNCGGSGSSFGVGSGYTRLSDVLAPHVTRFEDGAGTAEGARAIMATSKAITDIRIKAWLYKYDIFEEDWKELDLSEHSGNLVLPVGYESVQLRGFNNQWKAKYISYLSPDIYAYITPCRNKHSTVVITEDILSSYRIHRDCQVEAYACLGTSVKDELIKSINAVEYKNIFVWLDGDTAGMNASVAAHIKMAPVVKGRVTIIPAEMSPKEYTPEELRRIAKEYGIIDK